MNPQDSVPDQNTQMLGEIAMAIADDVPKEICLTVDGVRWLRDKYRESQKAPPIGSALNLGMLREECERRLAVVKNGVEGAILALEYMNPRLATEYLEDVTRYGELAKLDTKELTRRLSPNAESSNGEKESRP